MEDLVNWFESQGGRFDRHSFVFAPIAGFGRGAIALRDLPEGHTLFTLPRSLALSTRTSTLPARIGLNIWRERGLHIGWTGLILCMMWEEALGASSKWSVYLESLPKTFDTPMFWSREEISELHGTSVVDKIGKDQAERDFMDKVLPVVQSRPDLFPEEKAAHFTPQNYHIMGSRILSRSFLVEDWSVPDNTEEHELRPAQELQSMDIGEGAGDALEIPAEHSTLLDDEDSDSYDGEDSADVTMVPMADVLNARYGSENAKLFYEAQDLRMCTTKPITKGEQIWNTYGDPPNSDLLRRYGHVDLMPLPNGGLGNPADIVEVRADSVVACVQALRHEQLTALERVDWWLEQGGDDIFVLDMAYKVPDELISFVRLLLLPPSEWATSREKGKLPKARSSEEVVAVVKDTLIKRLGEYETTLETDEKFLAETSAGQLSLNKKHALVVRIGEKRILHSTLRELEETRKPPRVKKRKAENGNKSPLHKKR